MYGLKRVVGNRIRERGLLCRNAGFVYSKVGRRGRWVALNMEERSHYSPSQEVSGLGFALVACETEELAIHA